MPVKLTKTSVDAIAPGEREFFVWDTELRTQGLRRPDFTLRIEKLSGAVSRRRRPDWTDPSLRHRTSDDWDH